MPTVTLEEAQARLPELIDALRPGEALVIVRGQRPVATLVGKGPPPPREGWPCRAGSARDKILFIAPDFDAPLEDFREYME